MCIFMVLLMLQLAAEQPDLYGIRRSGRQRKEVSRLIIPKVYCS